MAEKSECAFREGEFCGMTRALPAGKGELGHHPCVADTAGSWWRGFAEIAQINSADVWETSAE